MVSKNARGLFVTLAVIALPACTHNAASATAPSAAVVPSAVITSGTWNLQSLAVTGSPVVTTSEEQFTMRLADDGAIALKVDCNRGAGSYTLSGNTLSVGPLATTKAYCASAPLDDQFLGLISGASVVTANATTLSMSSPRGTLIFAATR